VAALATEHPLAKREELACADLRELNFITNRALSEESVPVRWLAEQRRHGLPGRVAADAASIQEIPTLVAAGRGVCLVPAPVAQQYPRVTSPMFRWRTLIPPSSRSPGQAMTPVRPYGPSSKSRARSPAALLSVSAARTRPRPRPPS
jgi:DNA-binding transcriptional LysR family regulator